MITQEQSIELNGSGGYNAKDNRIYWYNNSSAFVEADATTGLIVRTSTSPAQLTTSFRITPVYGWDTTYAYAARYSQVTHIASFYRIQQSDFTLFDTKTIDAGHDYGTNGSADIDSAVSKTGRYFCFMVPDFSGFGPLQHMAFIWDYTADAGFTVDVTTDIGGSYHSSNICYDNSDNLWILASPNTYPMTMHQFDATGTHLDSFTITPTNAAQDGEPPILMFFDPDTDDIILIMDPISANDYDAGKTNVYRWNTITHTLTAEFGRWSKYLTDPDDDFPDESPPMTQYIVTGWNNRTQLPFSGFDQNTNLGTINLMNVLTGENVQYTLDNWSSTIPNLELDNGGFATLYSPGVFNEADSSFAFIGFTINFDASFITLVLDIFVPPPNEDEDPGVEFIFTEGCALPDVINELLAGRTVRAAHLVEIQFASVTHRLWNGFGILDAGGVEWNGMRGLGSIEGLEEEFDNLQSTEIRLTLSGVTPAFLQAALSEDRSEYVNRLVRIWIVFFNEHWQVLDTPLAFKAGIMDRLEVSRSQGEDGASTRRITLTAQNLFYGRSIPSYTFYTNRDQQLRKPGDRGLEFIPELLEIIIPVPW